MKVLHLIILATIALPSICQAQQAPSPRAGKNVAKLKAAIETIAVSNDLAAVRNAAALLQSNGVDAFPVLLRHINDERQSRTNYLTRAVTGRVTMGDICFWLIQDQLEDHRSKTDASLSPLSRGNIASWLASRSGMTLAELRREACIGSFKVILDFEKKHPRFNASNALRVYAIKLTELDAALEQSRNKARLRNTPIGSQKRIAPSG